MIDRIKIQNFRSIRDLEIKLGKMNAFIGPNNAGKSNIMRALNLVLGETWPSPRSFDDKDFYRYDKTNPIIIEVYFDKPLSCDKEVYGFRLTYNGDNCEYVPIDSKGSEIIYGSKRTKKVSNEMKEEVSLMYLSLERQASMQVRPSKWTLYGKLLRYLNDQVEQKNKDEFRKVLEGGYKDNLYSKVKSLEEILREHVKTQTGLEIFLRFSLLDPMEILSNLRPYFKEGEIEYDSEDMGAGIQSALAIAIAIAYAKIVRKPLIIAIEEPELYLHPHGCRHFYRLLKNLTEEGLNEEGLQVIYTTHERSFINISNYREIHIVRKENEETRVYSGINLQDKSEFDGIKSSSKFNEYINEVFFAEHVILVEGFSDKIACQIALEKLGLDLDLKNISIIECGGKKEIKPISEILKHFGIKTYVLIDADAEREISELEKLIGEGNVFKQEPDLEGMLDREKLKSLIISLGMEPEKDRKERLKLTKEQSLKVLPKYFEQNDIPETYSKLKDRIEGG